MFATISYILTQLNTENKMGCGSADRILGWELHFQLCCCCPSACPGFSKVMKDLFLSPSVLVCQT